MHKVIWWVSWFVLGINVSYAVTGLWRFGSQHVDAYGIWLFKAKAIQQQSISQVLHDPQYGYSHQSYPLLLPWILSWGDWALWVYPLIYIAILGVMYVILRAERVSPTTALGWVALMSFMGPLQAQAGRLHAGLGDIWITLAVAGCVWAMQRQRWWMVSGLIVIASMIKTEGIFLVAFLLVSKKWRWIIPSMVPFVGWQLGMKWLHISSDVAFGWPGLGRLLSRLGIVAVGAVKEMLHWRNWYIVWGIFWSNLLMGKMAVGRWGRVLLLMVGGYVIVYVFASIDVAAYVSSSIDRIMLQLLPLWWVIMATMVDRNCQKTPCTV
jgi:hypothetical protein